MRVMSYRVGEDVEEIEIDNTLEALQEYVDGYIEVLPLGDTEFLCICNEEGKNLRLAPNREIFHHGKIQDIIFGDFLVCKSCEDEFVGLTDDDIENLNNSGVIGGDADD